MTSVEEARSWRSKTFQIACSLGAAYDLPSESLSFFKAVLMYKINLPFVMSGLQVHFSKGHNSERCLGHKFVSSGASRLPV